MKELDLYNLWRERASGDPELITELNAINGEDTAIRDRFYRDLTFGTGGMRGVLGAGSNRMNIYTVRRATQGLADYLRPRFGGASVAIAYDSRINSELFAKEAARVLAGNGIRVHIFSELMPTPVLSYAVRSLKTDSGIVITASHNPANYNGYKVYGPDGCQLTNEASAGVTGHIKKLDMFGGAKTADFDESVESGLITFIDDTLLEAYLNEVMKQAVNPELSAQSGLRVVYTPLNGAGNKPVGAILEKSGVRDVFTVPEQEHPDGNFPTVPYPNPEIRQAFELAVKLAEKTNPDLLLATDPDCDRAGIAVRHKGEYVLISGNDTGCLLLDYLLSERAKNGTLPKDPITVKTIVTTPLVSLIAEKHDCEVIDVLTGFKYIGEQIGILEKKGQADRYVFGFEESYGFLTGTHVRDKDAVVASMLICEMAAFYKMRGMTLVDVLENLHNEFGYYQNDLMNFVCEGESGMERMRGIMTNLRENGPERIGGLEVTAVADFLHSKEHFRDKKADSGIDLPKSDVMRFSLSGGASVVVRPSGTEPKIKVYVFTNGGDKVVAENIAGEIKEDVTGLLGFNE